MKKLKTLFYSAGLLVMLGACSNDEYKLEQVDSDVLSFTTNIVPTQTRVTGNNWDADDAIGVFALETGTDQIFNSFENIKYITLEGGETGEFNHDPDNDGISLDGKQAVDLKAYYPYKQDVADAKNHLIDVSKAEGSDFLYSSINGIKDNGEPELKFEHQLSKFELQITIDDTAGNSIESLEGLEVTSVDGTKTQANFNLVLGKLSEATSEENQPITPIVEKKNDNSFVSIVAYVIPGQSTSIVEVPMKLNDQNFIWKSTLVDRTFEGGHKYIFKAALKAVDGGSVIIVNPDATIQDWGEGHEDTEPGITKPEEQLSLVVDPGELTFKGEGGTEMLTVTAPEELNWKVKQSEKTEWMSFEKLEKESAISVKVTKNDTKEPREAILTFSAEGVKDVEVAVSQEAGEAVNPEPIEQTIFEDDYSSISGKSTSLSNYTKMLKDAGKLTNHLNFEYAAEGDGKIDVRSANDGCIWFPSANDKVLEVRNINIKGVTALKVVFSLVGQNANKVKANEMKVKVGETYLADLEDKFLGGGTDYKEFKLEIGNLDQDELTLRFEIGVSDGGVRLGDLKVTGLK